MAKKGSYHHGDLRRSLLDAARVILKKGGPQAVTVREAARRARVSHNAPYRHFQDRDALLAGIAEESFAEFAERLERAAASSSDPRDRLSALGRAYVDFALEDPARYQLMFGESISDASCYPELDATARRAFLVLVEAVRACTPGMDEETALALAIGQWSIVHGLASLILKEQLHFLGPGIDLTRMIENVLAVAKPAAFSDSRR